MGWNHLLMCIYVFIHTNDEIFSKYLMKKGTDNTLLQAVYSPITVNNYWKYMVLVDLPDLSKVC